MSKVRRKWNNFCFVVVGCRRTPEPRSRFNGEGHSIHICFEHTSHTHRLSNNKRKSLLNSITSHNFMCSTPNRFSRVEHTNFFVNLLQLLRVRKIFYWIYNYNTQFNLNRHITKNNCAQQMEFFDIFPSHQLEFVVLMKRKFLQRSKHFIFSLVAMQLMKVNFSFNSSFVWKICVKARVCFLFCLTVFLFRRLTFHIVRINAVVSLLRIGVIGVSNG